MTFDLLYISICIYLVKSLIHVRSTRSLTKVALRTGQDVAVDNVGSPAVVERSTQPGGSTRRQRESGDDHVIVPI